MARRSLQLVFTFVIGMVLVGCAAAPTGPALVVNDASAVPAVPAAPAAPVASPTSNPATAATTPPASGLPTTYRTPTVLETPLDASLKGPGGAGGINSVTTAAGYLWLGSTNGLVRIRPEDNTVEIMDTDRGANVSGSGDTLWRAAFFTDNVMRYEARTGARSLTTKVTGPLGILATPTAAWVAEHTLGRVLKLDPVTADVLADTVVGTTECCGPGDFAEVGNSIWVVDNKDSTMVELDPKSGDVVQTVHLDAHPCDGMRYAAGSLWTCWFKDEDADAPRFTGVLRFDPATGKTTTADVAPHSSMVGEVDGKVWLPVDDRLIQLDARSGEPVRAVSLGIPGFDASNVTEAFGVAWVTSKQDSRVLRLGPEDLLGPEELQ